MAEGEEWAADCSSDTTRMCRASRGAEPSDEGGEGAEGAEGSKPVWGAPWEGGKYRASLRGVGACHVTGGGT